MDTSTREACSTGDYRFRSVYLPSIRGGMTELRATFDGAAPEEVVGKRAVTTVPTQSLFMLNSPFTIECSRLLAKRVFASTNECTSRIHTAFLLTLSRPPSEDELRLSSSFLTDYPKADDTDLAWTAFCQSLLCSAEFRYRY